MNLQERITEHFNHNIKTNIAVADSMIQLIIAAGKKMVDTIINGNKILICGNGAQAQYLSSQLLNRFNIERPSLPAVSLSSDSAIITAIGGDSDFKYIFAKQIKAIGQEEDILFVISGTGNPENINEALKAAYEKNIHIIRLTTTNNSIVELKHYGRNIDLVVPTDKIIRAQESYIVIMHCLCDIIDVSLFGT